MTTEIIPEKSSHSPIITEASRRYALFILFLAYVFNFVDRQIVAILQDPIKQELNLSDTQLGLLTGFSFALFYATLGVPIARLADRKPRTTIITCAITIWSAMTALCATAGNFASMLLFRIGVGIGEAGLNPSAHSLISDYFPKERRATAIAIYSTGIQVGIMFGYLAGGWINEFFGWRQAFLMVGLPGLALAALVGLTLREPPRGHSDGTLTESPDSENQSISQVMHTLWHLKTFRYLALGCGVHAFVLYAHGNWAPPFFGRIHNLSSGEIGTWLAILAIGPGALGIFISGLMADYFGRKDMRAYMWLAATATALAIPFAIGTFLVSNAYMAITLAGFKYFLGGIYLAPCIAIAQTLVAPNMRASTSAVLLLMLNIIGLGLGPFCVGLLSDIFTINFDMGNSALRYALVAIIPIEIVAVLLFLLASRNTIKELQ